MAEKEEDKEDEEDDDDWDAFQSFPNSANAAGTDSKVESISEEPVLVEENSSVPELDAESDFFKEAVSQSPNNTRDAGSTDQEDVEGEVIFETPTDEMALHENIPIDGNEVDEPTDFRIIGGLAEPCDGSQHYQEVALNKEKEEGAGSSKVTEQIPSDLDSTEDAERLVEVNISEDQELRREYSDNESEPGPSDTSPYKGD